MPKITGPRIGGLDDAIQGFEGGGAFLLGEHQGAHHHHVLPGAILEPQLDAPFHLKSDDRTRRERVECKLN